MHRSKLLAFAFMLPLLIGCGGKRVTPPSMATAEVALQDAARSDAHIHAPVELELASEKLERARWELDRGDYKEARLLSEQATIDARYAETKAETAKALRAADELKATRRVY